MTSLELPFRGVWTVRWGGRLPHTSWRPISALRTTS